MLTHSDAKPDFQDRAGCGRRTDDRKSDDSPSGDRTERDACDDGVSKVPSLPVTKY